MRVDRGQNGFKVNTDMKGLRVRFVGKGDVEKIVELRDYRRRIRRNGLVQNIDSNKMARNTANEMASKMSETSEEAMTSKGSQASNMSKAKKESSKSQKSQKETSEKSQKETSEKSPMVMPKSEKLAENSSLSKKSSLISPLSPLRLIMRPNTERWVIKKTDDLTQKKSVESYKKKDDTIKEVVQNILDEMVYDVTGRLTQRAVNEGLEKGRSEMEEEKSNIRCLAQELIDYAIDCVIDREESKKKIDKEESKQMIDKDEDTGKEAKEEDKKNDDKWKEKVDKEESMVDKESACEPEQLVINVADSIKDDTEKNSEDDLMSLMQEQGIQLQPSVLSDSKVAQSENVTITGSVELNENASQLASACNHSIGSSHLPQQRGGMVEDAQIGEIGNSQALCQQLAEVAGLFGYSRSQLEAEAVFEERPRFERVRKTRRKSGRKKKEENELKISQKLDETRVRRKYVKRNLFKNNEMRPTIPMWPHFPALKQQDSVLHTVPEPITMNFDESVVQRIVNEAFNNSDFIGQSNNVSQNDKVDNDLGQKLEQNLKEKSKGNKSNVTFKSGVPKKAKSKEEMFVPKCQCIIDALTKSIDVGPLYTHLGSGRTLESLRCSLEQRTRLSGEALRIEKVVYCKFGSKTTQGCPVAKYVVRRKSHHEKLVAVVKNRPGHYCDHSWLIVALLLWDGLDSSISDNSYDYLSTVLGRFGESVERQCSANRANDCACQGLDTRQIGASFSFGCAWNMFMNGCKYGRSETRPRRFKLTKEAEREEESRLEHHMNVLAWKLSLLLQILAPKAFDNMSRHSERAKDCRIGADGSANPFAGVTAVLDFCAHEHTDRNNMEEGCTVVLTLLKPENRVERPQDEQYHILPYYRPECVENFDENQANLTEGMVVLDKFERMLRVKATPTKKRGRNGPKGERKAFLDEHKKKMAKEQKPMPPLMPIHRPQPNLEVPNSEVPNLEVRNFEPNESISKPNLPDLEPGWPNLPQFDGSSSPPLDLNQASSSLIPLRYSEKSDCKENFQSHHIGGLAFALTHGSVLIECAKEERHATSALQFPNRRRPTRIGLVFYQHRRLHFPDHGKEEFIERNVRANQRDYEAWTQGKLVPTRHKLSMMKKAGFLFPEDVEVASNTCESQRPKGMERPPHLRSLFEYASSNNVSNNNQMNFNGGVYTGLLNNGFSVPSQGNFGLPSASTGFNASGNNFNLSGSFGQNHSGSLRLSHNLNQMGAAINSGTSAIRPFTSSLQPNMDHLYSAPPAPRRADNNASVNMFGLNNFMSNDRLNQDYNNRSFSSANHINEASKNVSVAQQIPQIIPALLPIPSASSAANRFHSNTANSSGNNASTHLAGNPNHFHFGAPNTNFLAQHNGHGFVSGQGNVFSPLYGSQMLPQLWPIGHVTKENHGEQKLHYIGPA